MESQLNKISGTATGWLFALRLAIGWHFLYEGLSKLLNGGWTSIGYLLDSKGMFAPMFYGMANNPGILSFVNFLSQWGLVMIGLGLILGLLTRWASYAGMLMLVFYYLSHPPVLGVSYALPAEGNYFIIDKVAVEFFALGVVAMFPVANIGLGRFFQRKK